MKNSDDLARRARLLMLFAAAVSLLVLMQQGRAWSVERLFPALLVLAGITLAVIIVFLLPLALSRRLRGFSGMAIYCSFYLLGGVSWLCSVVVAWDTWGVWAATAGIVLLGITVVPLAIAAAVYTSQWITVAAIVVVFVVAWACRVGGAALIDASDDA